MTAEIALMNRIGVALAADSAVTIGRDATKIYGSAEKLFQLSNSEPVGVMVYGNAMYQGLPWETTIKAYRRALGNRSFPTIEEYALRFREYITDNDALFPARQRQPTLRALITTLALSILNDFRKRVDAVIEEKREVAEDDLPGIVADTLQARLDQVSRAGLIDGFDVSHRARVRAEVRPLLTQLRTQVFGTLPFNRKATASFRELVLEYLARTSFGPFLGGVVVAGFGHDQFLPAVISFEVEEAVAGRPRWRPGSAQVVGGTTESAILAFAQQETVVQFLEGIDPHLREYVKHTSGDVIGRIVSTLIDKLREYDTAMASALESAMKPELGRIINGLHEAWAKRRDQQAQPVVNIVSSLPKDELAAMAESLVNLTKFRRRVTPERETVGGPIDVAVITKGDGFVWVRRKHYFDPALNPRVIAALQATERAHVD